MLGDGDPMPMPHDSVGADPLTVIRDSGLEWAPWIVSIIGAIFLVGLTFYLVRRGLSKSRNAMRL